MKSHASDFLPFAAALLQDAGRIGRASSVNIKRDFETIKSRFEHEGLSFLTITLPDFGAAFDRALSEGQVDLCAFPGWKKHRHLPAFLRGFVCQVFDVNTGGLLDEPSISCIKAVRQIAYCFKKIGLPCSRKRERKAIRRYIENETELKRFVFPEQLFQHFGLVSDLLWGGIFRDFNIHELCPKHGPGAVVEKYTQNSKYANQRWHERLEPFFPVDAYIYCNINDAVDRLDELVSLPEDQELPVKVTLVPKTLKGPRIIAIEPCCMQYAQQALAKYLIGTLEKSWYTRGHINFRDQTVNQELAMNASSTGLMATLDLKDASDRIHLSVVQRMLKSTPDLLGALLASRSKAARLPSGDVISLTKFASMGSAVCFPVEAMVFYTITICALLKSKHLPVSLRNIHNVSRDVYVYGDDIIVNVDQAQAVADLLEAFGNRVNSGKSYIKGFFRESCGVDAFRGNLVTPTYLRSAWPRNRGDVHELVSLTASGNQFYLAGYYLSLLQLKSVVEGLVGPLPQVAETCSGLGWFHPFNVPRSLHRFNRKYQVEQVLTWVPGPVYRVDTLDGWAALLKFFIKSGCTATRSPNLLKLGGHDEKHLRRTPRYGTAGLKRRWVTPY